MDGAQKQSATSINAKLSESGAEFSYCIIVECDACQTLSWRENCFKQMGYLDD